MLDYGYRSACCYAPIRMGKKKIKGTHQIIGIWCCTKCSKRDVRLVDYTGEERTQSRDLNANLKIFAPDENEDFQDTNDPRFED